MSHTPIDFLLSAALIGAALTPVLELAAETLAGFFPLYLAHTAIRYPVTPVVVLVGCWLANQLVRIARLQTSTLFEGRASFSLLSNAKMRPAVMLCVGLGIASAVLSVVGVPSLALLSAILAVITARYLFFVSVVPLSMGLTFIRGGQA